MVEVFFLYFYFQFISAFNDATFTTAWFSMHIWHVALDNGSTGMYLKLS